MPYDLHGTYYASARDAEIAETTQMNEIDNRILREQVKRMEREKENKNHDILQYLHMLESRIADLESKINQK